MVSTTSSTEDRALSLLGQGLSPVVVASAIGVSESRISQLLSQAEFASAVAELRYKSLLSHNERDRKYDDLEDALLEKMKNILPFMVRPMEILKALTTVNAAKRRGAGSSQEAATQTTIVQLIMPSAVLNQYTAQSIQLNTHNQVIKAGDQSLVTIQSGRMDGLAAALAAKGQNHVQDSIVEGNASTAGSGI